VGGGRKLALVPTNKRVLDVSKARPVLAKHLSGDELDRATTISASAVDDIAAAKAPKGKGAATLRAIRADLEAAGALSINTIHQMKETKAE
jgi:hypothetical protein